MNINRDFMFDKVNFFLKKENKFFTSSEVMNIIALEAPRRVAEDINFPKSNLSAVLVSGAWTVNLSSDFIKIDPDKDVTFKYSGGTIKLKPKLQKDIGRDTILTADPSTPEYFFPEDEDTIGVYPPSSSGILVIPFVKEPTSLSSTNASNELTQNCYMAMIYWTVGDCMLKDGDSEKYETYIKLYDAEIIRLRRRFGEMYDEQHDVIPHEDYI